MKRLVILLMFITASRHIIGQDILVSGGINTHSYCDFQKDHGHYKTDYTGGQGFSFGAGIVSLPVRRSQVDIFIRFDYFTGKFITTQGGLGGATLTHATVGKSTLSIGCYPVQFSVFKKVHFSLGAEYSLLLSDDTKGYQTAWTLGGINRYTVIDHDPGKINNHHFFGLGAVIRYGFRLSEHWVLMPQYRFYLGLTNGFNHIEAAIKSYRNHYEIGILKRFK